MTFCQNCKTNDFYVDTHAGDYICKECGLVANEILLMVSYETSQHMDVIQSVTKVNIAVRIRNILDSLNLTMDTTTIVTTVENLKKSKLSTPELLALILVECKIMNISCDMMMACEILDTSMRMVTKYYNAHDGSANTKTVHIDNHMFMLVKRTNQIGGELLLSSKDMLFARKTIAKLDNVIRSRDVVVLALFLYLSSVNQIDMNEDLKTLSKRFRISKLSLKKGYEDIKITLNK